MSALHQQLVDTLTDQLGTGYSVLSYPPDAPPGRAVAVWTTNVTPGQGALAGQYVAEFTVELYTRHTDPEQAESDLAASLEAVLDVLWRHDSYVLTRAERTTNEARTQHQWTLTVVGGLEITPED